jgi:hypothetical protein
MVAENNIPNNKILQLHVTIIQVNQYSMILKKDGHVVIKLSMIGTNSKNYLPVPKPNIPISNNNKLMNFSNRIQSPMPKMPSQNNQQRITSY